MLKDGIMKKLGAVSAAQSTLKANISEKGIITAENDRLPQLAEKVGELENEPYAVEGQITLVSSSAELTVSNLPQKPVEVGIVSRALAEATVTAAAKGFVVPSVHMVFPEGSDSVNIDGCSVTRSADSEGGTWSVNFSFAEHNASAEAPIKFQGGYIYTWLVLFHKLYEETENEEKIL